jgi:hypothetical protein
LLKRYAESRNYFTGAKEKPGRIWQPIQIARLSSLSVHY